MQLLRLLTLGHFTAILSCGIAAGPQAVRAYGLGHNLSISSLNPKP